MKTLTEYEQTLEKIGSGAVSIEFAREILEAAKAELAEAGGEFTITQAVELSGRSRSWFERRLPELAAAGTARQLPGGLWLLKRAAIPSRWKEGDGLDPALDTETLAERVLEDVA